MNDKNRMMDNTTFKELLEAGELGLILMDGGKNLTAEQMRLVKAKAKEQSEEKILKQQMELATKPGYAESVLTPLVRKILEQSGGTPTQAKPTSGSISAPKQEKLAKTVAVEPKVKPITEPKQYAKKAIEKSSKKTGEALSSITDVAPFFNFIKTDKKELQEQIEDFEKEQASNREKRHKEIMQIIISATKKKQKAEKKIKSEVKKDKAEAKKEETKPPTKGEAPKVEAPAPKVETPKVTTPKAETPAPKVETPKVTTPAPTAKQVPATPQVPTAKPNVPALFKPPVKAVATGGLLTAAALSVRGETGARSIENIGSDVKKVGQVVQNDPKPGVSSYGIFGINSGGSVQKFVSDNPQFNLIGKPGSNEFDESWKKVAAEKTNEFYQAQLNWYDKYVYQPVKNDMQKLLPPSVGTDDKVITYMADRRNQMGKVLEQQAIAYAKDAKTPDEFVIKIAEHDISDENIRKAFPTYIKTHGEKNIPGLKNRVELRKKLALQVQSNVGEKISDDSVNNAEMKKLMRQGSSQQLIIQQNIHNTTNRQQFVPPAQKQELNPTMQ